MNTAASPKPKNSRAKQAQPSPRLLDDCVTTTAMVPRIWHDQIRNLANERGISASAIIRDYISQGVAGAYEKRRVKQTQTRMLDDCVMTSARIPRVWHEQIHTTADERGISASAIIRDFIGQGLSHGA